MSVHVKSPTPGIDHLRSLRGELVGRQRAGQRFAGLIGEGDPRHGVTLCALMANAEGIEALSARLPAGCAEYRALTPEVPGAFWYERALHDLFGIGPRGHPRLDPLVLPHHEGTGGLPCPGAPVHPSRVEPDERAWPRRVLGTGMFTIPHGPVRSGVFESVEYVVETPGEDISHVNVRPFAKHRGVQVRFDGLSIMDGSLLAERVEGISSVAHALGYAHAVESGAALEVPGAAALVRVVHAELERVANHLDVAMKLADAAGLAVAVARFGWHKEGVLRLIGRMCGSRFGRGVVIPGGIRALPRLAPARIRSEVDTLAKRIGSDEKALMETASFLDRLRGTGPLQCELARRHGALGPIGRASGCHDDVRWTRPYDAYPRLHPLPARVDEVGDAMARLRVRWVEAHNSFALIRQALDLLSSADADSIAAPVPAMAARSIGWAEAAQGEVLYVVATDDEGKVHFCAPRSASFHNLALFPATFQGDVLTDFPFIEASFGLSIAGVVM
ncbi:MAG: NADH-quinone oxidoreductase subunit C [Sciscionella sp.]